MKRTMLGLVTVACLALVPALASGQAPELHWYKGNTHTHIINSDSDTSPDAVVRWYREHGYQFLFVTDHEFITDPAPLTHCLARRSAFWCCRGRR